MAESVANGGGVALHSTRKARSKGWFLGALSGVAVFLAAPRVHAVEIGAEGDPAHVDIHAFASQGFVLTTNGNNYLAQDTTHGSFQLSEVGVNVTKSISDRLRLGLQLFAQALGPTGNYDAKMDWFYVDYRFKDWLGIRAGRVKIPFGLYNEVNDIDSARVPILLPQSVYPFQNRDYLLAQTGGELYGIASLGGAGSLEYRLYGGTIFLDIAPAPGSPYTILSLNVPYLVGSRVLWETPLDGLRTGFSVQGLRLDTSLLAKMETVRADIEAVLGVASVEYAARRMLLTAEYSLWYATSNSSDSKVVPIGRSASERAYAMASYRAAGWLQPGIYYSVLLPDAAKVEGRENVQHDVATTLRFDLTQNWLVKIEAHYMIGTAALSSSLNDNMPLSALNPAWSALLLRTTGYF